MRLRRPPQRRGREAAHAIPSPTTAAAPLPAATHNQVCLSDVSLALSVSNTSSMLSTCSEFPARSAFITKGCSTRSASRRSS